MQAWYTRLALANSPILILVKVEGTLFNLA